MSGDLFSVQFIRSKNCFLFIPEKWVKRLKDIKKLETDSIIKIVYDANKTAYFSWQETSTKHDNVVGINATVASNLDLKEGDLVSLVICNNPARIHRVEMFPLSSDDLEMIEQSSGMLQATLLNQVRVIWKDQLLTAWISNTLPIVLRVGDMEPNVTIGRLEQLTEVVIGDPIHNQAPLPGALDSRSANLITDIVNSGKSLASSVINAVKGETHQDEEELADNELRTEKSYYIYRVHPLCCDLPQYGPLDAFLPNPSLVKFLKLSKQKCETLLCKIARINISKDIGDIVSNQESAEEQTLTQENKSRMPNRKDFSTVIRVRSVDVLPGAKENYYTFDRCCIYLSNNLRNTLDLEIGAQVILSDFQFTAPAGNFEKLELFPHYSLRDLDLGSNLIKYMHQMPEGLLLGQNTLLTIPTEKGYIDAKVQLIPPSLTCIVAKPDFVDICKIQVRLVKQFRKGENTESSTNQFATKHVAEDLHLVHLQSMVNEGLVSLRLSLGLHEFFVNHPKSAQVTNNVLILGKKGFGKTSIANALCGLLNGSPHYVHNAIIKFRPLKGKTVESLSKQMQRVLNDCIYHQPSILVLDDVDCVAGVAEDQDPNSPRSAYFNRVSRMLLQRLSCLQSKHSVAVIATAQSTSCLSPVLVPPRGIHFFSTQLEILELSKEDRRGVLEKLLHQKLKYKNLKDVKCFKAVEECAKKTEGYCCQDLADLVDKATLAACMRQVMSCQLPILESCDLDEALMGSSPMLLRGVSLHKDSEYSWDDIGGLSGVKTELNEVFEWPVMYPDLFQNSPLRQQSGLLLYGAPGTGKTMLAGAVASECGLNFISVKGPELLSKYIGASEEAVRNIFFKAQSAKPCVLFFDEFDSLAPRRGHDNTGVTDRVVNQLLTQLDGVESLVGVWVLAATSRPDLLDPALLRPGRLDRSVLCPLPDKEGRLSILKALSRKMNLDPCVDFTKIAAQTEGFSGADLQSVLYTAQLNAVEEQQTQTTGESNPPSIRPVRFLVNQSQLDAAAKSTRPSLTTKERMKYELIYKKFGGSRKGEPGGVIEQTLRATLA